MVDIDGAATAVAREIAVIGGLAVPVTADVSSAAGAAGVATAAHDDLGGLDIANAVRAGW